MGLEDRFAGTPDTATPGSTIPVKFKDPSKAGQTVDCTADDDQGNTYPIKITLNANGEGTTNWALPPGYVGSIGLNGPDSREHDIIVMAPAARSKKTKKPPAKKPPARSAAKGKTKR